jgi:hypothetical protein
LRAGSRNRGATLIEVTIYSAVLIMLLGGLWVVVEGGMRFLRLSEAGQTVNQQAVIGLRKVLQELTPASQASLDLPLTAPPPLPQDHVTFLSPESPEGDPPGYTFAGGSDMEWRKWISIFQDGNQLVRVESELGTFVTDPATVPIPDFATVVTAWPRRKPIANDVADANFFRINPAVVRVEIVTSVSTGTGKTTDMQLISSVRLLNE